MKHVATARPAPAAPLRAPTEADLRGAGELLGELAAQAAALGPVARAAPVHHAMGRVWIERLGDPRGAAVCYQNAFALDPSYRPNLEAARRLFAGEGAWERALALHRCEEKLLQDPAVRAESLRAQAWILAQPLARPLEAAEALQRALVLAPEHPALLAAAAEAALDASDRPGAARLLLRAGEAVKDGLQRAALLRQAVLLLEELEQSQGTPEAGGVLGEAARKLQASDPDDPVGTAALLSLARAARAWDEVLRLSRQLVDRGGGASAWVEAAQAALQLGRPTEALAEVEAGLAAWPREGALHALATEILAAGTEPGPLATALLARAAAAVEPSERADCKLLAAQLAEAPAERDRLLDEALRDDPADAAAAALQARLTAAGDGSGAAERVVAAAESLRERAPAEAAEKLIEAAAWRERSGDRAEATGLATRALEASPHHPAALRLLQRTLPPAGETPELARLLEEAAAAAPPHAAAELLGRAAALLSDLPGPAGTGPSAAPAPLGPGRVHALDLARRAADLSRGTAGPSTTKAWALLALRFGDLVQLSQALEGCAAAPLEPGADPVQLLVEAAEISRALRDDGRAAALLLRARQADPSSTQVRRLLLALPDLPAGERAALLAEEARGEGTARAAALQAERAALLEQEGHVDEAVQACALALSGGAGDLAVMRRLHRLQLRRGDLQAALAALVQIAAALPEGPGRAEACARAAELCEWRLGEQRRALALYQEALAADPGARLPLAGVARLAAREGRAAEAAEALEKLAEVSSARERAAALRQAIALRAHRTGEPERAAALSRQLLAADANDLQAAASLLQALAGDPNPAAVRERAGLRARLAAECRDPHMAALLRAGAAEDWLASGERDRGIADYRRALAHNPHDRRVLDAVEEALRGGEVRGLLAEHLAFRCEHEEPRIGAACSLRRAELLAEDGDLAGAAAAFRAALAADPDSVLAATGARLVAVRASDQAEAMRLLTGEVALAHNPGIGVDHLVEAALLAEKLDPPDGAAISSQSEPPRKAAAEQPKPGSAALEQRATAAASTGRWAEAAAAYRELIQREVPRTDWVRALSRASARAGDSETAFSARAALVGLGAADAAEKAAHDQVMSGPPLAELPPLADGPALLGEGDAGPARELLAAAAAELARTLPTALAGRGGRVKADNPVRRVCAAIGRALGLAQEPALYLAKGEPGVVLPVAAEAPGLLVGAEVPRRFPPRQPRFLDARALAHLRRGTHMLADLPPQRLEQIAAELARACAPADAEGKPLPPRDEALGRALAAALTPEARQRLEPLAAAALRTGLPGGEALALGIRETAERTALAICGDPAAGLSLVAQECPGGLGRPELARLLRFALSDAFLPLRGR
jgi:hypothetical protein